MPREAKSNKGGVARFVENGSVHSWTSRAHTEYHAGGHSNECDDDDENLGVLILEGEEEDEDDGEDAEEENQPSRTSDLLSVPETEFLPSEIRSLTVASGLTRPELNKNEAEEKGALRSHPSRSIAGISGVGAFNGMRLKPAMLAFVAFLLPLASWRCLVWKEEALLLREDERLQKSMLPLALSLLKERQSLLKRQKQLEEEIRRRNNPDRMDYDDSFLPDKLDGGDILSFKNCYAGGSLSLGNYSREWQEWWSGAADGSGAAHNVDKETHDGGFTGDTPKVKGSSAIMDDSQLQIFWSILDQ